MLTRGEWFAGIVLATIFAIALVRIAQGVSG